MKEMICLCVLLILACIGIQLYHTNQPANTRYLNEIQDCANKLSDKQARLALLRSLQAQPTDREAIRIADDCGKQLQQQNLKLSIEQASK